MLRAKAPWAYTVVLVLAAAGFLVVFLQVQGQARRLNAQAAQGRQAHSALCAFREDLRRRAVQQAAQVQATEDFLRDHPQGIPGIPIQLLRQSLTNQQATLRNQQSTLKSIDALACSTGEGGR